MAASRSPFSTDTPPETLGWVLPGMRWARLPMARRAALPMA